MIHRHRQPDTETHVLLLMLLFLVGSFFHSREAKKMLRNF